MTTTVEAGGADPDVAIGERVHQLMWRQRISQTDLARRLGIGQPTLSRKLRGERPWFASELIPVAGILGVSVGELYGEGWAPWGSNPQPTGYVVPQVSASVIHLADRRRAS